jgi:hypothetical protein
MGHFIYKMAHMKKIVKQTESSEEQGVADRLESRQLHTPYKARSLRDRLKWATILVRKYLSGAAAKRTT